MSDERSELVRQLEAVLFVSDEPLSATVLAQALEVNRATVEELLSDLASSYEDRDAGIVLRNVAGGWRLSTHPAAADVVEKFVLSSRHVRLTKAALETLSIVAYKQPVTRHQVAAIRGVNADGVLRALTDRGLVAEVGRDDRCSTRRRRGSWSASAFPRSRRFPRSRPCSTRHPKRTPSPMR